MHENNPLATEWRAIEDVKPYARNPRIIPEAAVDQVAASIREFGWRQPIVIDEAGVVLVGHTRRLAALKLGHTHVPVHVAAGLTPDQARAYRLADNRVGEATSWNLPELNFEIAALAGLNVGLDAMGFGAADLKAMFKALTRLGQTDPEAAPPAPAEPVSRVGDVWLLGDHRIVCGSSTEPATVEMLLDGARPHLMVTDPPYGVNYDASWRQRAGVGSAGAATGRVLNDDRVDWREAWALFPGSVAYVWHGGLHSAAVQESLASQRFDVRAQIIWVKQRHALSRGHYHWQHEPAWYAVRGGEADRWRFEEEHEVATYAVRRGAPGAWEGGRRQSTVWPIEHFRSETGHSTQKPVECMKRPIENNSLPGDGVYEPFLGSGTTVIAGEMTGRRVFGVELDPYYVDVVVERWQAFTGRAATSQEGRPFALIAQERKAESVTHAGIKARADG